MKHSRIYPFERNKFFYGKLLTVRDFESEQKYFNDKRRMLNRLLYGPGVLCGLRVVAVDDKTISVGSGVALDCGGREIVVSKLDTQKLSQITGFCHNDYDKNVYLCLAYDEQGKETIHSVDGEAEEAEKTKEYNRIEERYKLFIREETPNIDFINYSDLIENRITLYKDSQLMITLDIPKYTIKGEVSQVRVRIEKALQVQKIELKIEAGLNGFLTSDGKNTLSFAFSEKHNGKESIYEECIQLKTLDEAENLCNIVLKGSNTSLKTGDKILTINEDSKRNVERSVVEVIDKPIKEHVLDKYYGQTLEKCLCNTNENYICIAQISLKQDGTTYKIGKIKNVPFNHYVRNESLLERLNSFENKVMDNETFKIDTVKSALKVLKNDQEPWAEVLYDKERNSLEFEFGMPISEERFSSGNVEIKFGEYAQIGEVFYSDEIDHKLGEGNVFLSMGVVDNNGDARGGDHYIGDLSLFDNDAKFPQVSFGGVLYPQKGKFKIAIKLNSVTKYTSLYVRWWAYKM